MKRNIFFSGLPVLMVIAIISCSKEEINNPQSSNAVSRLKTPSCYESEPNNTMATADDICTYPGAPYLPVNGTINTWGDEDWFKVTSTTGMIFGLTGSAYYLTGYVYNSAGTYLGTIRFNSSYSTTATGTVYVKISGYSGITYQLSTNNL